MLIALLRRQVRDPARMWRRIGNLAVIGFASGMPLTILGDPLKLWLKSQGLSIEAIGVTALLSLPYTIKFLWAPLVDRFAFPGVGRRRSWLMGTQIALAVLVAGLAAPWPQLGSFALAMWLSVLAIVGATQDLAVDAYRAEICGENERGIGASASVIGYRLAMSSIGWLALALAPALGWPLIFLILSGLFVLMTVVSALRSEPPTQAVASFQELVALPATIMWRRFGTTMFAIVFLAASVRAADSLLNQQAALFLKESLDDQTLGFLRGGLAMIGMLCGTVLGGWMATRWGVLSGLGVGVVLGGLSNGAYVVYALVIPHSVPVMLNTDVPVAAVAVFVEALCGGILGTAMVAWFMSLCDARCAAMQYALLSSLSGLPGILLSSYSGVWAVQLGWPWYFTMTTCAALPAVAMLPWILRRPATLGEPAPR